MTGKDFDASRRQTKKGHPVPFRMFGRDWEADEISEGLYIDAFAADSDEGVASSASAMRDLMDVLVIPTQRAAWKTLWRRGEDPRPPVGKEGDANYDPGSPGYRGCDIEDMQELLGYVGEQQFTGRPTTPSSNSSRSPGGTGTKSTRGTSAKAASPKRR